MSTQDKLERVLRDIHVLISRSELYDNTGEKIIVEKKKMFEYLNHLNACIYEMMDEYEVTQQSRDKAEREARKKGDAMIFKAFEHAVQTANLLLLTQLHAITRQALTGALMKRNRLISSFSWTCSMATVPTSCL